MTPTKVRARARLGSLFLRVPLVHQHEVIDIGFILAVIETLAIFCWVDNDSR